MKVQPFDTDAYVLPALLWQHNNAQRLTSLLQSKQAWLDENQANFWTDWHRDVFDLRTANEFGLQVWGIILGIPITIVKSAPTPYRPVFGFGAFNRNFWNSNFFPPQNASDALQPEDARFLLQLRYFALICRPCTWQINEFLARVFPLVSCRDVLGMSAIEYRFKRPVDPALMTMLVAHNVLPRPATLGLNITVLGRKVFGYGEFNENYNNGAFASV